MSLDPNFPWPARGKPSSRVIQTIDKKNKIDWEILVPHESIRFLMSKILAVLENFNPLEKKKKWQHNCLAEWLRSTFYPVVHWHHHIEDSIWMPEVQKRGAVVPDRTHIDHEYLLPKFDAMMKGIEDGPFKDEDALNKWKDHVRELFQEFGDHMAFEEEEFPKCLRAGGLTEKDLQDASKAMMDKIPGHVQGLEFPCILYTMHIWFGDTKEIGDQLKEMGVPFFIFHILNWHWLPHFQQDTIKRLDCLIEGDSPFQNGSKKCGCC